MAMDAAATFAALEMMERPLIVFLRSLSRGCDSIVTEKSLTGNLNAAVSGNWNDARHGSESTGSATIGERLAHKGAANVYLLPFLRNPFTYRKPCRSRLGREKKQSGRDDRNAVHNM